ncbi:hypothetical protein GCM10010464_54540 [Pseudonocardia yunnanensis]
MRVCLLAAAVSVATHWSVNRSAAAEVFWSRCASEDVLGIGHITGERANNQAGATCAGVDPV